MQEESLNLTGEFLQARFDMSGKAKQARIDDLCSHATISLARLQRVLEISYPQAASMIQALLDLHAIVSFDHGYKIVAPQVVKNFLYEKA